MTPKAIQKVSQNFEKLPGIGPKTAQRLAYYLLHVPQPQLDNFAESLQRLKLDTQYCSICKNIGGTDPCEICSQPSRNQIQICVVEQPLDITAIEKARKYSGTYHVLHGVIAPLDHIGPDQLYIDELLQRIKQSDQIEEIILALNPSMEGEATSLHLRQEIQRLKPELTVTRLAQGLPLGGDVEYADAVTLSRAFEGRRAMD